MSRLLIRRPVWLSLLPWLAASLLRAGPVEFASPMLEPGPFLLWDTTFTVRGGGGHKDNPSYAPDFARSFREPGAFMALGAEVLLLRVPTDGNSFFLFFTGDDRRYFDAPDVRKEQTFVTQAQFKHEGTGWTTSLTEGK